MYQWKCEKNKVVVVVVVVIIIVIFFPWNALCILSLYLLFLTQILLKYIYSAIECESWFKLRKIQKAKSRRATCDEA